MSKLKTIHKIVLIFCLYFTFFNANAQLTLNNSNLKLNEKSFIGSSFNSIGFNGYPRFYSFHDFDPSLNNPNFHQHDTEYIFSSSTELFNIYSINFNYLLHERIQFFANLPYHIKSRKIDEELKLKFEGIAEIEVGLLLNLWHNQRLKPNANNSFKLNYGLKVFLPNGKFNLEDEEGDIHPHLQPSNNSEAFQPILNLEIKQNKWNTNVSMFYKLNTQNYYKFKFGNILYSEIDVERTLKNTGYNAFNLGLNINYYFFEADQMFANTSPEIPEPTGGSLLNLKPNFTFVGKAFHLHFNYEFPLVKKLKINAMTPIQKLSLTVAKHF